MPITIVPKDKQANGQFNGGAILEKKPIGFPQDGGGVKPYSNLFYWAHAWSDKGSLIGEHPHKGFEILSFVLEGDIEHYDNKLRGWRPLKKGDAQIIRAGNGISHAEKLNAHSEIFQIWFDPNLEKTLEVPASYDDYTDDKFPVAQQNGVKIKTYKGDNAPLKMETEGISIKEFTLSPGTHQLPLKNESVYSVFVVTGTVTQEKNTLNKGDYAIIKQEELFELSNTDESKLFVIESPAKPSYKTYAEMYM